jgi:hypothetical protein
MSIRIAGIGETRSARTRRWSIFARAKRSAAAKAP